VTGELPGLPAAARDGPDITGIHEGDPIVVNVRVAEQPGESRIVFRGLGLQIGRSHEQSDTGNQ
jgi:hypothetical protein